MISWRYQTSMKNKNGNIIVLFFDLVSIIISYLTALRFRDIHFSDNYVDGLIVLLLMYMLVYTSLSSLNSDIYSRGYMEEYGEVFRIDMIALLMWAVYLFMTSKSYSYSRLVFIVYGILSLCTVYVARCYIKLFTYLTIHNKRNVKSCIIIADEANVLSIIKNFMATWDINIVGVILSDSDRVGGEFSFGKKSVPIIGSLSDVSGCVANKVVDDVFISVSQGVHGINEVIYQFERMGVKIHLNLDLSYITVRNKIIESMGPYNVVTFATTMYSTGSLIVKRLMDIMGGIVGLVITAIAFIFVAPAIWIEDKGPVFFSQKRVGKNGRIFKIYKFRSMYVDAEERKKELMKNNEMSGAMFKMKDDPRITKVGKFIRKTSIDELPQFLNILKGDMSLVGTRPPTIDEVNVYENWHRRRLSIKPGLTGLWQVSGRNKINDFDDVVKYDLEYIDNWSVLMDIKLILKTIFVVFKGTGS